MNIFNLPMKVFEYMRDDFWKVGKGRDYELC